MRLEIIIPDSTRPDIKARLTSLTRELSAHPDLVEEIYSNGDLDNASGQELFTPERLAIIDAADAEIDAGEVYSAGQVRDFLQEKHAKWLQAHPI